MAVGINHYAYKQHVNRWLAKVKTDYNLSDFEDAGFYHRLIRSAAYEVLDKLNESEPDPEDDVKLADQLDQIYDTALNILHVVTPYDGGAIDDNDDNRARTVAKPWYHRDHIQAYGPHKSNPYLDRSMLQDAVAQYLRGTMRARVFDRLLVDLLIGQEMFGYINDDRIDLKPIPHPILGFLWGQLKSFVGYVLFCLAVGWLTSTTETFEPIGEWVIGLATLAYVLLVILSIGLMVFAGPAVMRTKRQSIELYQAMAHT